MKLDRTRFKKPHSELNDKAKSFIDEVRSLKRSELTQKLSTVVSWEFGKNEFCLWADVLDSIDEILEAACEKQSKDSFALKCDVDSDTTLKAEVLAALKFTALLFEYSFTRSIYSSMEHLISLLESSDIKIVVAVLSLLYVFSKRTNFLGRLQQAQREILLQRLCKIAESWGGKENGFSLSACCLEQSTLPKAATSVHFEFFTEDDSENSQDQGHGSFNRIRYIHIENVHQINKCAGEIVDDILRVFKVPKDKQTSLLMQVRLAQCFGEYEKRLNCVIARLLSLSVLIYSGMLQENNNLLYSGFIEECVETLQLPDLPVYMDVKTEILKTLTSIIYLDRNPRLNTIIDATGASAYHGFLPLLVRGCIQNFIDGKTAEVSHGYVTALFSLLYHMAGYDNGAEALVSSALTESLLSLVNWIECPVENITYLTRSVRIIDLITNVDTQVFQNYGGMHIFVSRLAHEIDVCRVEQPNQILVTRKRSSVVVDQELMDVESASATLPTSTSSQSPPVVQETNQTSMFPVQCPAQRVVLIKSLLNFVKKAVSDPQFSENVRHIMDGSLPASLCHIISNPDYYGSMLFLLAITVVTHFINQEPSQLTSLQDKGLTDVVMHALLVKDVPASREVLGHLPQAFTALCLNERGLNAFIGCRPFDKLFKVLLSTKYLNAMRRLRSSDHLGDTASSLGAAIDELMRHQPTLKPTAMESVIKLLGELCSLGQDSTYTCISKSSSRVASSSMADGVVTSASLPQSNNTGETSDEDEDEEDSDSRQALDLGESALNPTIAAADTNIQVDAKSKIAVPLIEYVQNVMKFIEAILSNNSTDDHARLFIQQNGLQALLKLLTLNNLPADFGASTACTNIASVVRYLFTLTKDRQVIDSVLVQLQDYCLINVCSAFGTNSPCLPNSSSNKLVLVEDILKYPYSGNDEIPHTQLTHYLGSLLNHLIVLTQITRLGTSQNDLKLQILQSWIEKSSSALRDLHEVYRMIVWESTVMLAMCSSDCNVNIFDSHGNNLFKSLENRGAVLENRGTFCSTTVVDAEKPGPSDVSIPMNLNETTLSNKDQKPSQAVVNQLKPLIALTSRIGRQLAEMFSLLTRVSVGGPVRSRRGQAPYHLPATQNGISLVESIVTHLGAVIEWAPNFDVLSSSKLWFTYLVCIIGYLSQLMFDDRRQAYHLILAKFYTSGTQQAYFRIFNRLLSMIKIKEDGKQSEFPEGCSEFLEAWLGLVEKLLSTQCVLDSSNQFFDPATNGGKLGFSAVHFLAATQRMAFDHIMTLWAKLTCVNSRVSEIVLSILCHIVRSEKIILKELKAEKDPTQKKEKEDEHVDQINPQHLQQLIDMGFVREIAIEALMNASSVEQAAEICVAMPIRHRNPAFGGGNPFAVLDEDEQIQQAIALSLTGSDETGATETDSTSTNQTTTNAPVKDVLPAAEESSPSKKLKPKPLEEVGPMDSDVLQRFFDRDLLACCFQLIDSSGDLVYRVADLLSVVVKRSTEEWTSNFFINLSKEILLVTQNLLCSFSKNLSNAELANMLVDSTQAIQLTSRLHLFCLLFEEFKQICGLTISNNKILSTLIQLLSECSHCFVTLGTVPTKVPRWLAPLLLCLDGYDRESTTLKQRQMIEKIEKITWKFWDNRNWTSFTPPTVNKQLTDAFKSGLRTVKFTINRRRYMVDFSVMVQINLDSGYQRPIVMFPSESSASDSGVEMNAVENEKPKSFTTKDFTLPFLMDTERSSIIKSVVDLIDVPVDADTLHAALRLCLRLTRNYSFALEFLELGGVQKLLRLRQSQSFTGLPVIVSLLIRHIMEDDTVLRHTVERVIRSVAQGGVATTESSGNPQELYYVLRLLGPVACRDTNSFLDVVKKVLRIKVPPPRRSDDDEAALRNSNLPIEVRVDGTLSAHQPLGEAAREVLSRLLNYLVQKQEVVQSKDSIATTSDIAKTSSDTAITSATANPEAKNSAVKEISTTSESNDEDVKNRQPLVLKSAVLKLIAELIRSYSAVAAYVAEYRYTPPSGDLITEECTALSFFLDNLLLDTQTVGDAECPQGVKSVIATLASANHCEDAQSFLVSEVKAALQRALSLNESLDKHSRICTIVALTTLMKDSCPSIQVTPPSSTKGQATLAPVRANNIMKWFVKKKIVLDLARIPHALDLSSPSAVTTINAVLKPLEELTRLINAPNTTVLSTPKHKIARENHTPSNVTNEAMESVRENSTNIQRSNENATPAEEANNRTGTETTNHDVASFDQEADREAHLDETVSVDTSHLDQSGLLSQQSLFGITQESNAFNPNVTTDQTNVSGVSLSTDSESSQDSTSDDEESQSVEENEDETVGQDEGNEHGSEQDDEASEYDDVNDELMENEQDDVDDDDMSDYDENVDMQIHLQATDSEGADPFGILNDVLRDALSDRSEQNRDYGVFVTTRGGAGMSIPDVEQFLAVAPEPTVLHSSLGMLGTTHPLLIRHADSPASNLSTNQPGSSALISTQGFSHVSSRSRFPGARPVTSGLLRQGAVRHRTYRYVVNAQPNNNSPAILQRLLGPGIAQELLQLTQQMPNNAPGAARFVITEDDLRDSGFYDEIETNNTGRLSLLTTIPNAYMRWMDESKIMDGDAVHFVLLSLRSAIIDELERNRSIEFETRKEKRLQMAEEEKQQQHKNKAQDESMPIVTANTTEVELLTANDISTLQSAREFLEDSDGNRSVIEPVVNLVNVNVESENEPIVENFTSPNTPADQHIPVGNVQPSASITSVLAFEPATHQSINTIPVSTPEVIEQQPEQISSSSEQSGPTQNAQPVENESDFPEGVDPAFLEALPDNIRQEVIADQLRLQRLREQNRQLASRVTQNNEPSNAAAPVPEVSPEFLAALPPELQDEVLAQQRLAQQQTRPATSDAPFDPAAFMEALPPSLRQQVLADADESQFALLPPQFAAEARRLRAQLEQQQAVRFAAMSRQFPFMNLLNRRNEAGLGRQYATIRSAHRRHQHMNEASSYTLSSSHSASGTGTAGSSRGQQLLDKEAIVCLLVIFFFDDPRLNIGRLHRILKSLCYHQPTRDWVVRALLSILEKTQEHVDLSKFTTSSCQPTDSVKITAEKVVCGLKRSSQNWLNLTLKSAVGNRMDVFDLHRQHSSSKKMIQLQHVATIHVHPQAAAAVCRHVLDTLISLAKSFPTQFLPTDYNNEQEQSEFSINSGKADESSVAKSTNEKIKTDFWEVLIRLDNTSLNFTRKPSKQVAKVHASTQIEQARYASLDESPLGHVMSMLKHPVMADNHSLMDRVLRLLSLVVTVLPTNINDSLVKLFKDSVSAKLETLPAVALDSKPCLKNQLSALVEVVTRGQCSDEGLEDGRGVLLQAARCFGGPTRKVIFFALINAAKQLGVELNDQIKRLLNEIATLQNSKDSDQPGTSTATESLKPMKVVSVLPAIAPVGAQKSVVQSATSKELQLPAMAALTKKSSVQQCLLRTLNTILMLRDAKRVENVTARPSAAETQRADSQRSNAVDASAVNDANQQAPPKTVVADATDASSGVKEKSDVDDAPLSSLLCLTDLWDFLGECLRRLTEASDPHAVLVLQPAVEAFFLVHAGHRREKHKSAPEANADGQRVDVGRQENSSVDMQPASPAMADSIVGSFQVDAAANAVGMNQDLPEDTKKFVKFAEEHRTVLNQILRQSTQHLPDGPFAILVDYTRILDFDVKRRYFRKELERYDDGIRRDDNAVRVRRDHVFQDSFRELFRLRPNDWKGRLYIIFEGEEGQDAGGLLREWFSIITREIFNPNYALFKTSPGDRVTYMINPSSYVNIEHLDYFKFVGRLIAKAVYDNKLLDCYFTRAFYKHILGKPVRYTDLESEDPSFYQSLCFLLENPVDSFGNEITFSLEVTEFGLYEVRDLKPNGRNILVTDENKVEYVRLVCQMKMTGAIRQQLNAFLSGFYDIIPRQLIGIFNEQELELLISGLPTIDVDDLQANTEYHKYNKSSLQIQWFWRALRSFDQADRAKFLQFVTGTSKVPLQGFAALEGMHGIQRFQIHRDDRSTDRLPTAHTCFNQLDLPVYESYDKLKDMLLLAIRECTEGFGFA